MKKLFFIFILFSFSVFIFAQEQRVYKVVIRSDWKPYYFINEEGKPDGYAVELFEHIAKEAKIRFEFVIAANFQEIIQLLNEGKVDIVPNISIVSHREALLLFTQPTDNFMVNIYKHEASKNINTLNDIENRKIGLVSNNICAKLIDQNYTHIQKTYYVDYKSLIEGLLNKEVDVFCYPKPLIEFVNGKHPSSIVPLNKSLQEIKRGVGIIKSNFDLLPHLDEAITNLKLTGKLDALQEKWFKEKKYIELSLSETIFLVVSFFGILLTSAIVAIYFIHKKKWLLTNAMLEKEVEKQTLRYKEQNKKLEQLQEKLKQQLNKDTLTNVYNRTFYNQKIQEMLSLYQRHNMVFSFLIFDIDDFKYINDNYGHSVGDHVLVELCALVQKQIRLTDYLFRVGGEEFIVLFSNTSQKEIRDAVEKLRLTIEKELNVLENRRITVSMGLTQVQAQDTQESIFNRADELLYEAKKKGKNQVIVS